MIEGDIQAFAGFAEEAMEAVFFLHFASNWISKFVNDFYEQHWL
jgi:hypothetical protein